MNLRNFFSKLKRRNVAIAVVAWLDDRAHKLACSLVRHDDKNSKKLRISGYRSAIFAPKKPQGSGKSCGFLLVISQAA
jgi:hypothetical protein